MLEAYILHATPWRDTSLLPDVLVRDEGRQRALARGARSSRRHQRGGAGYQPFCPLLVTLKGRSELRTVAGLEPRGGAWPLARRTVNRLILGALMVYTLFWTMARIRLGPIDRILTRIGAGEDLARGQSTFMVEMSETSYILHHATAQSLVLMDEIGRGTSTYDGLALAEACAKHLANGNRCYTLFATHYFELTALAQPGSGIANVHLDAVEHGDTLVFMHAVKDGPADRSFGLQVAALAGLPKSVVREARGRLAELEQQRTP